MEVILLSDVEKVGLRGEVVQVARGFARNYLIPRRLAEAATPGRVAEIKRREATRADQEARTFEQAQEIAETLGRAELRFEVKTLVVPEGGELPPEEQPEPAAEGDGAAAVAEAAEAEPEPEA